MATHTLMLPKDREGRDSDRECQREVPVGVEQQQQRGAVGLLPSSSSFESLPLAAARRGVAAFAASQNFVRLTPVQVAAIPLLLKQDAAVQAVTGSGKTLAFLIPIVETVLRRRLQNQISPSGTEARRRMQVHSVVLSPTRELAQQTFAVAKGLFRACGSVCLDSASTALPPPLLLTGGGGGPSASAPALSASLSSEGQRVRPVTLDLQTFRAEGNDVLVGTPGRVNDFLSYRTAVDCSELEYLILDEADIMFDNGALASTLSDILSRLPKQKRVGLFSATTNSASLQEWMVRVGMRNPVWVDVAVASKPGSSAALPDPPSGLMLDPKPQQRTPVTLSNFFISTHLDEKLSRLVAFLQDHKHEKVIVFFLTCACVDFFGRALQQLFVDGSGPSVEMLHGKLVQKRREKTLERFHSPGGDTILGSVLACTDVAARGLNLTDVDWVVQFDPPQDPAMFIHRVGRTARAGKDGKSLLFLTPKEEAYIELLHARQVPIHPLQSSERCCPAMDSPSVASDKDGNTVEGKVISSACSSSLTDVLPKIRHMVLKDRDLLEKGTQAFTSYVRAYKEHRCAFIFRFQSLDLGRLASSFALLRLPKMPELRNRLVRPPDNHGHKKQEDRSERWQLPNFEPAGPEVDIFAIPYADPHREAARQRRLNQKSDGDERRMASYPHKSLSGRVARISDRVSSGEKRRESGAAKGPEKKRSRNAKIVEEWDELAKEERLYKKLRKKKVTQEQFDDQFMGEE